MTQTNISTKFPVIPVIFSFATGLIFGFGLVISGMSNPAKVQNFLDLFGTWDPSLIFVMGGAVTTVFLGNILIFKLEKPLMDIEFHLPVKKAIDPNLIIGAALFGIGWGLAGFCPGPAFTSVFIGSTGIIYFLPAMLAGMWIAKTIKT